ncbi:MAG: alpha/beta hydrolase [Acidimicrobiales bacterium]
MPQLTSDEISLTYEVRGPDSAHLPVVLIHGLLFSSRTMQGLSSALPDRRVFLLDLRGHGNSSAPREAEAYTRELLVSDVVALLDHVGLDRVVLGGMSLGAAVTLEVARRHPDRLAAIILEMPVFSRSEAVGRPVFGALARGLSMGAPALGLIRPITRRVPVPRRSHWLSWAKETVAGDHRAMAALLRGILRERLDPASAELLQDIRMPALVVAHGVGMGRRVRDPIHVLDDSLDAAEHLPNSRLVRTYTFFDHRANPRNLAQHIRRFLADVEQGRTIH